MTLYYTQEYDMIIIYFDSNNVNITIHFRPLAELQLNKIRDWKYEIEDL